MVRRLIVCGNDFWLKLLPERLSDVVRLPLDAVEKVALEYVEGFRVPFRAKGCVMKGAYCERSFGEDARTLCLLFLCLVLFYSELHDFLN